MKKTINKADNELLVCKNTVTRFTLKHAEHIYLIESQPLRFDNNTKPYRNFVFISITGAAL